MALCIRIGGSCPWKIGMPAQSAIFSRLQPAPRAQSRFGIGAKLQMAFWVVAGLTVLAAAVAFLSFASMERGLRQVTGVQVPMMTDAMRLSVISGDISATAARFISARTADDQKTTLSLIEVKQAELNKVMERVKATHGGDPNVAALVALTQRLDANLGSLEDAIVERTTLREQIEQLLAAMHRTHSEIVERLARLSNRTQALEIASRSHLLVSVIGEGSIVREPTSFKPIQDRLRASIEQLREETSALADGDLKSATARLIQFGQGSDSIFARRARELFTTTRVDGTIDENVAILRELDGSVSSLMREAEAGMERGTAALTADLDRSRTPLDPRGRREPPRRRRHRRVLRAARAWCAA